MYDIIELNNKLASELKDIAKELNVPKYETLKKQELIYKILDQQALNPAPQDLQAEKKERHHIFRTKKKPGEGSTSKPEHKVHVPVGSSDSVTPENKEFVIDDTAVQLSDESLTPIIVEDPVETHSV